MPTLHRTTKPFAVATLIVTAACTSGCYRKIVGARGLGASGVQVEQATQPTFIDRLLGPAPTQTDDRPRMRVN